MTNKPCLDRVFGFVYSLGSFLRRLALPESVQKWSLKTLHEKRINIGPKAVKVVSGQIISPPLVT